MKKKAAELLSGGKIHNSVFDRKFMYLSDIIDPIYHEYLIKLERSGYELDLDVLRPHHQVENFQKVALLLISYFEFVIKNPGKGNIIIAMTHTHDHTDITPIKYSLILKDSSTILNLEQRERFTMLGAKVKTRLGFGTTLSIEIREPYDKI